MKVGNLARVTSVVVALSQIIGISSCSKKASEDEHAGESPDRAGEAAVTPGPATETDSPENKRLPASKTGERHATIEQERLKSVARQIDDIELQQKKLGQAEEEKRMILNRLRGLPGDSPIDITKPMAAKDGEREVIEGEQAALDAYLLVASELQMLEAKKKLHTEQMARVRAAKDQSAATSEDLKRD